MQRLLNTIKIDTNDMIIASPETIIEIILAVENFIRIPLHYRLMIWREVLSFKFLSKGTSFAKFV